MSLVPRTLVVGVLLALLVASAGAQTTVTFWHSMGAAEEAVDALAASFNAAAGLPRGGAHGGLVQRRPDTPHRRVRER